jgi:ketosteroid isomerase-like protein
VDGETVVEAGAPAPILGAFAADGWSVEEITVRPEQQLVVVTDGITEATGPHGRFGENRLRATLAGVSSPARAAQQIEAALHEFTGGELEDDAAIVALAPTSTGVEPAPQAEQVLIERLYTAFNRRDPEEIVELCDEEMGFFPFGTAEEIGRTAPYVGPAGLTEYLHDVDQAWDELLISPKVIEHHGRSLLVRGRVYVRSRALGIRDMPVAWIWDLADGKVVRGEVFRDPEEAVRRLAAAG